MPSYWQPHAHNSNSCGSVSARSLDLARPYLRTSRWWVSFEFQMQLYRDGRLGRLLNPVIADVGSSIQMAPSTRSMPTTSKMHQKGYFGNTGLMSVMGLSMPMVRSFPRPNFSTIPTLDPGFNRAGEIPSKLLSPSTGTSEWQCYLLAWCQAKSNCAHGRSC